MCVTEAKQQTFRLFTANIDCRIRYFFNVFQLKVNVSVVRPAAIAQVMAKNFHADSASTQTVETVLQQLHQQPCQ